VLPAIQRADHLGFKVAGCWLKPCATGNRWSGWRRVPWGRQRRWAPHANHRSEVEALTCQRLGLVPTPSSTQVIARSDMPTTSRPCFGCTSWSVSPLKSAPQRTRRAGGGGKLCPRARKGSSRCHTSATPIRSEADQRLATRAAAATPWPPLRTCPLARRASAQLPVERMMLPIGSSPSTHAARIPSMAGDGRLSRPTCSAT